MSPLSSFLKKAWPLLLLAVFFSCSESRDGNLIFDPAIGHPKSWIKDHGPTSVSSEGSCEECHGSDLRGGISQISCFTPSNDGQGCHESGPGVIHTGGWRASHTGAPTGNAAD